MEAETKSIFEIIEAERRKDRKKREEDELLHQLACMASNRTYRGAMRIKGAEPCFFL